MTTRPPQWELRSPQLLSTNRNSHRIAASRFEATSKDLFLDERQLSKVKLIQRVLSCPPTDIISTSSRTATSSTLVDDSCCHGHLEFSKETEKWQYAEFHELVVKPYVIENAEQLLEAFSTSSSFRCFQITQENSFARLQLTRNLYDRICQEIEVFELLNETITYMGFRCREAEVSPPRIKWRLLDDAKQFPGTRGWECAYSLRYIEENGRPGERPWSLRQFAAYNRVDIGQDCSSWIFVSPPTDVVADFNEAAALDNLTALDASVGLHMRLFTTALSYWRSYVSYLTIEVDKHVRKDCNPSTFIY